MIHTRKVLKPPKEAKVKTIKHPGSKKDSKREGKMKVTGEAAWTGDLGREKFE